MPIDNDHGFTIHPRSNTVRSLRNRNAALTAIIEDADEGIRLAASSSPVRALFVNIQRNATTALQEGVAH